MKQVSLRDARRQANLTQDQLSKRSDVPQATISKIETGALLNPRFDDVRKLSSVLKIDPQALKFGIPSSHHDEAVVS